MMVIDSLGVDDPEASVGAPESVEGPRSQRGCTRQPQAQAAEPQTLLFLTVTLGKSLNLRDHFLIYKMGLLIPHRAPGKFNEMQIVYLPRVHHVNFLQPPEDLKCSRSQMGWTSSVKEHSRF